MQERRIIGAMAFLKTGAVNKNDVDRLEFYTDYRSAVNTITEKWYYTVDHSF